MSAPRGTAALAIEASTRAGRVALLAPGSEAAVERELDRDASHGSDLVPAIDALLRESNLQPRDIGLVVVGRGPGSYTGLRVASATALGLVRGTGARAVGVCSFDAVAGHGLQPGETGAVAANAFGGNTYVAVYRRERDGTLLEVLAPACVPTGDASRTAGSIDVVFSDAATFEASGLSSSASLRPFVPSAPELLRLGALRADRGDADDVRPLYLRPFEAKVRAR